MEWQQEIDILLIPDRTSHFTKKNPSQLMANPFTFAYHSNEFSLRESYSWFIIVELRVGIHNRYNKNENQSHPHLMKCN